MRLHEMSFGSQHTFTRVPSRGPEIRYSSHRWFHDRGTSLRNSATSDTTEVEKV